VNTNVKKNPKTAWSTAVVFAASAAKFWNLALVARTKHFRGVLATFLVLNSIKKEVFWRTTFDWLFVNLCRLSFKPRALMCPFKQDHRVPGHWVDIPHVHKSNVSQVGPGLFRCPNSTELYHCSSLVVISRIWKTFCQTSGWLCTGVEEMGNHHGQEAGYKSGSDSSRNKWTFGSGSLLYWEFRRRCDIRAWNRKKNRDRFSICEFMWFVHKLYDDVLCSL